MPPFNERERKRERVLKIKKTASHRSKECLKADPSNFAVRSRFFSLSFTPRAEWNLEGIFMPTRIVEQFGDFEGWSIICTKIQVIAYLYHA